MSDHDKESSYSALRVDARAPAPDWWTAASRRRDAPRAIASLLDGRTRVEVPREEALRAIAWAAGIVGWPVDGPKPVFMHQPVATT